MASTTLMTTKDGRQYYRIYVSRGKHETPYTTRWYVPEGWSKRSIDSGLRKAVSEFEAKCSNGEVLLRSEQKAIEKKEAEERAKIQTFQQYAEKVYMPSLSVTASENTRSSFEGMLKHHVYPALGFLKMPEITPEQITAFLLSLQSGTSCKKPLSHASCVKVYTIINLIFKQAYLSRMVSPNPMDFVQRPKAKKSEIKDDEIPSYSGQEVVYILRCLENEPLKWRALIRLIADTGCRRGEALGLKWSKVDFDNCTITIDETLNYTAAVGIYTDTPKSRKRRIIDVSDEVVALLKEIKAEQDAAVTVKDFNADSAFVFTQDDYTTPMHPTSPTRYFKKMEQKYGITDFHPHKLRHSFASIAITNGADIASVSEKLGHADKSTTLRMYTHADAESIKRAGNVFRNALKQAEASVKETPVKELMRA